MLWLSLAAIAVTSFQWFLFGYSLTFSHETNGFIGNHHHFVLLGVNGAPSEASTRIPDTLLFLFYGNFESFAYVSASPGNTIANLPSVALAIGAVAERGRILPSLIFMFIWSTVIYNPIAYWTWNPNGWIFLMGGLDFSGGTPVHITSGCTALAYSYMLGKRKGHGTQELNFRPHNVTHIAMGTVFLWVGWFGFTAGSALGANMRAVMAFLVTNLAACAGGITWSLVDYRLERKWSTVGFCSGVVAGLVAITPGSGFVPPWAAIIFGVVAGAVCNYATKLKYALRADDALDIFAVHAVGGFTGNILTAFFAA
jgi:Amt family ammonium transporter